MEMDLLGSIEAEQLGAEAFDLFGIVALENFLRNSVVSTADSLVVPGKHRKSVKKLE